MGNDGVDGSYELNGSLMISVRLIFAAMSDARPGRFYSVDELAALLRVYDKAGLRKQLQVMAGAPDPRGSFKLLQGPSDEFFRRVSLTLCAPLETKSS